MNASLKIGLTLVLSSLLLAAAQSAEFSINGNHFTLPDGFEIEQVAGTNLLLRPVSASFDDHGHLFVTDSSGSNEKPMVQLKNPTHRIVRLEDSDGDGSFDKSTVFAERVMFPQGCLWHDGSVYVAGPPSIWKYTDTTGQGIADKKEEWFNGGTLTGCANDIHGPYLGPDGYLYWTKGAFDQQTNVLANGVTLKDRAAHIYRARPDKSGLDVIMSGGMDNPVEVAFTAEGEAVFTSTFIDFSQPGFRDGIGHAIWGGVYGKQHDVIENRDVIRTSPDLLHPFYQAGPGAESGLCRYQSDAFGSGYRDNLFASSFNLHKITRHILTPNGASYASSNIDFLVSDSPDFHPTDVLPDADGSLLVLDTGAWYKLCCPSSQLSKPDVLGAIYRIKKARAKRLSTDHRLKAYLDLTGPPTMAGYTLASTLKQAVWKNDPANAKWFRELIEKNASASATNALSAHVIRVASEGLGRLRDTNSVHALLEASQYSAHDPFLEHSLIYALTQIGAASETRLGLKSTSLAVQRAAMVALDQMNGGKLRFDEASPLFTSITKESRRTGVWLLNNHPEWGDSTDGLVNDLFKANLPARSTDDQRELLKAIAAQKGVPNVFSTNYFRFSPEDKIALLKIVAESRPKFVSESWLKIVCDALSQDNPDLRSAALDAAHQLNGNKSPAQNKLHEVLKTVFIDANLPRETRLDALYATWGPLELTNSSVVDILLGSIDSTQSPALRSKALEVLTRTRLDKDGLKKAVAAIPNIGPVELLRFLGIFESQNEEELGQSLLAALQNSKPGRSLPPGNVRAIFARYPASVQTNLSKFLQDLDSTVAQQSARLDSLLAEVKTLKGDVRRGQLVFNSAKASCMTCHKFGYVGGTVGPDLTSMGAARTERDLLEAIVYPSASFVRSFEPTIIITKQGDVQSGIVKKETPAELVLITGANAEVKIAKSDIAEQKPGTVSVMPQGLDEQLTKQELADLLAFLYQRQR